MLELLIVALLSAIFAAGIVFAGGLFAYSFIKRKTKAFFDAPAPDTASQFATIMNFLMDGFAAKIMMQAKATFMGKESGDVRAEKAVQGELFQDVLAQTNPTLSAILSSFPSLSKHLKRNPAILPVALQALQGIMAKAGTGAGAHAGGNNGNGKVTPYISDKF